MPGEGPLDEEWATVNLDVDGDGMITEADLVDAVGFDAEPDDEIFWPAP